MQGRQKVEIHMEAVYACISIARTLNQVSQVRQKVSETGDNPIFACGNNCAV